MLCICFSYSQHSIVITVEKLKTPTPVECVDVVSVKSSGMEALFSMKIYEEKYSFFIS